MSRSAEIAALVPSEPSKMVIIFNGVHDARVIDTIPRTDDMVVIKNRADAALLALNLSSTYISRARVGEATCVICHG